MQNNDVQIAWEQKTTEDVEKKPIGTRVDETDMPNVMKTMLRMMREEKGHNHSGFRRNVCFFLGIGDFGKIQYITSYGNGKSGEDVKKYDAKDILSKDFTVKGDDKSKKLWARHLFDTYTMLCTKIANNFIRYDTSQPKCSTENKGGVYYAKKRRRHVDKLGAIDVLNDKRKITNILGDFAQGEKYLATRGNWYLPGAHIPYKIQYGLLINQLNTSISDFAIRLLKWYYEDKRRDCTPLLPIMNEMDDRLANILKDVHPEYERKILSSTILQPWNKACNLKKCGQLLYSKCKLGNNVITGQFFSGKNSRSGKPKYKEILNDCIKDLMNLKDQEEEEIVQKKS